MATSAPAITAPIYDVDLFTDAVLIDPYEHYRAMRELGPVVWLEAHGMYAMPRYAEVRAALADAATYCSGKGAGLNDTINGTMAGRNLIMTDGDLHQHLRQVLGRNLTPRALRSLNDSVEQIADALIARLVEQGSFDAVTDLARALPLTVVPDLVGWPKDGREHLLAWAGATFNMLGPLNERAKAAVPLMQDMMAFAAETAATENVLPGSVAAGVIDAARRGDVEPERVSALIVGYLAPSLDTTISAIGNAVWLLANNPDQWAALRADPNLVPNAFNEVVRIESPIRVFSRVSTTETTFGEVMVPTDARLAMFYGCANRDDQKFPDAGRLDVARRNAGEQIGFGYGTHGCAGQGLARMEGHALLAAMVRRVERIEINGTPTHAVNNLINAWSSLPVTFTPTGHG